MKCLLCNTEVANPKYLCEKEYLVKLWKPIIDVNKEICKEKIFLYQCKSCSLDFFDPALAGGNEFYSELGKLEWYYLHPGKTEYEFVQNYIKEGDNLLDIGSGRGELYNRTKKRINYTGLELSTKAVELAKEAGINVKNEDLLIHSKANVEKYDIVTLFQVLEHLTELENFITAIHSCLKKDGLFVIAVPNNDGFISYSPDYLFNLPPHHTILWKEASLVQLAKKFNFEIVKIEAELLQDVHKNSAYGAYKEKILKRLLFIQIPLINNNTGKPGLPLRILRRISNLRIINKIFDKMAIRNVIKGQSIIVVLRKK